MSFLLEMSFFILILAYVKSFKPKDIMKYIIVQIILKKQDQNGSTINNYWENIIREVTAKDEESAIGKFVIQTAHITAKEKLGIECILLDDLKSIS